MVYPPRMWVFFLSFGLLRPLRIHPIDNFLLLALHLLFLLLLLVVFVGVLVIIRNLVSSLFLSFCPSA
jgi:hypothetical protein